MDFTIFIFECPAPFSVSLAGEVEYLRAEALLPLLSGFLLMISLTSDFDQYFFLYFFEDPFGDLFED